MLNTTNPTHVDKKKNDMISSKVTPGVVPCSKKVQSNRPNQKLKLFVSYHLAAFISNPSSTPNSPRFHFLTSRPQRSQSLLSRDFRFSADEGGLGVFRTPLLPLAFGVPKSGGAGPAGRPKRLRAAGSAVFLPNKPTPAGRALRGDGEGLSMVVSSSGPVVKPVYGEFEARG